MRRWLADPTLSQQPREKTRGPRAPRQPATKPILRPLAIYTGWGDRSVRASPPGFHGTPDKEELCLCESFLSVSAAGWGGGGLVCLRGLCRRSIRLALGSRRQGPTLSLEGRAGRGWGGGDPMAPDPTRQGQHLCRKASEWR